MDERVEISRGCAVGIDPGERWIGVARAARESSLALPVGTLDRRSSEGGLGEALRHMLGDESVADLIVGVPLRPDGREDEQATAFRMLGEELAASLGARCVPQNERFSNVVPSPEPVDQSRGRGHKARSRGRKSVQRQRRDRQRSHADAAARILQRWLDARDALQARNAAERPM